MLYILLVSFFYLLFFLPVKIRITYQSKNRNDKFLVNIYLFFSKAGISLRIPGNKKNAPGRINSIFQLINNREIIFLILKTLNLKCRRFYWKTELGLSDPALTGIVSGIIWGIKGALLGLINNYITLIKKPELAVYPDFYHQRLSTSFEGIFLTLSGNIILTIIKIVMYKIRGGYRS